MATLDTAQPVKRPLLQSPKDWPEWFKAYSLFAKRSNIWHICQPDRVDDKDLRWYKCSPELDHPLRPSFPGTTEADFRDWQASLSEYHEDLENYNKQREAFFKLEDWVDDTVAKNIKSCVGEEVWECALYQRVRALRYAMTTDTIQKQEKKEEEQGPRSPLDPVVTTIATLPLRVRPSSQPPLSSHLPQTEAPITQIAAAI